MNRSINLLIVDDDMINVFITSKLVESIGAQVLMTTKPNGQEAVNYLQQIISSGDELPDLILLDLNMPVLDGWGFLSIYESMRIEKEIDIFLLSASVFESDIKRSSSFPCVKKFLIKPLSKLDLIDIFDSFNTSR